MPKKIRSIVITFCVGLFALAAYWVVSDIINKQGDDSTTSVAINRFNVDSIASIKVTLADGQYYYITEDADISQAGETSVAYKVTFNGVYEGLAYDASAAKNIVSYACNLDATRDLGSTSEDELVLYGLDNPQSVVTMEFIDKRDPVIIYVGAYSSSTGTYYCKVSNSDHVFVISGVTGEAFTGAPDDMRISQINVAVTSDTIETLTWKYKDNPEIYIYKELEASVFNPYTNFYVAKPWSRPMPVDGDRFPELVNGLNVLYINEYITPKTDGTEVNLADYGLDEPWGYYKLTGKGDVVQEFSFGDYVGDSEYYCYMLDHSDGHIYTVARDRVAFIEKYTATDVTTPLIFNATSDEIQSIVAEYDGKTSKLEMFKVKLTDEEKAEIEAAGGTPPDYNTTKKLDNVAYDEYHMGTLYKRAFIRIQRAYDDDKHDEIPILKMTITPFDIDEEPLVITYYRSNDNYCVAYVNGQADFMVSMKEVKAYIDAVDAVKAGREPK